MNKGLGNLEIYREAMEIAETVWDVVVRWSGFAQRTIGEQWVRSSDSIAANIAEGYGRYHYKENLKFCFYARGSLEESGTWLNKARNRDLLDSGKGEMLANNISILLKRLNAYIGSISRAAK